jgi:ankyrin repeat protein
MRATLGRSGIVAAGLISLLIGARTNAATDALGLVDAARTQDQSRVRALLAGKADVNTRSDDGSTALLWAAHWNDVATADLLIRAHATPTSPTSSA